jgi:starch synthase
VEQAETPETGTSAVEEASLRSQAAFDGSAEGRPLSILIAGAEAVPYVKTGGLADVVDAVARGLAGRGHDVTLVLPNYRGLKRQGMELRPAGEVAVPVDGRIERGLLLVGEREGVRVVLVDHPGYYDRDGGPYSGYSGYDAYSAGGDSDADVRFGFYARAALEAVKVLGIKPDVVHSHDWHAALIPAFLKLVYKADPFFAAAKTVLTIHNIAFQGAFGKDSAVKLGFKAEDVDQGPLGFKGGLNMLKAGIELADSVTTVSPTYAREITDTPEFGMGMEASLAARRDGVSGILNGVDPALNDPRTDLLVGRNYGADDAASGKAANKGALQARLGLEPKPDAPLFVVASRFAQQKGIDLIVEAARSILALGGQLAITGSGDKDLEEKAAGLAAEFPGQVAVHPFDEVLVHLVYAAGDFLLMPSRFEPCGLSQLIAQRFGTLPLVTRLGGLADTVTDWRSDPDKGDGLFLSAVSALALADAVAEAVKLYSDKAALAKVMRSAMEKDSSWGPAMDAYEALLRRLSPQASVRVLKAGPFEARIGPLILAEDGSSDAAVVVSYRGTEYLDPMALMAAVVENGEQALLREFMAELEKAVDDFKRAARPGSR